MGVYDVDDLGRRALVRSHYPVTAMAFHPDLPLLAIGTGCYDGGYFFMGELLLTDLETGRAVSLIDSPLGPQVLALEWLTGQDLRVLVAPPHDGDDAEAWVEGHVAVVSRPDWRLVPPASITWQELAGPRVAAPRPDHREEARRAVSGLSRDWDPRRNVRAVEELSDGRILATLDEVRAESWLPSGQRQWTVADDKGGRDLVVATDERSVWVGLVRPTCEEPPQALVRLSLQDGAQIEHITLSAPASLVCRADGLPALAPAGDLGERGRLRIRRGSRVYFREIDRPGVETTDGSLVYAGTVHHGQGLQPGGSFVVRREIRTGEPRWVFRTDRTATDLDADAQTAYVAYDDGEIVALDLQDGTVRRAPAPHRRSGAGDTHRVDRRRPGRAAHRHQRRTDLEMLRRVACGPGRDGDLIAWITRYRHHREQPPSHTRRCRPRGRRVTGHGIARDQRRVRLLGGRTRARARRRRRARIRAPRGGARAGDGPDECELSASASRS
nr:hypothetical protein GCM10020092_065940 [Actinoplanes digitatis]